MNATSALILFALVFSLSGCAQKITVKAFDPAEIGNPADTRSIAVTPFSNDDVYLAEKIETEISNQYVDGKPYFKVIKRAEFNRIVDEQAIKNIGLLDESTALKIGNLLGVQELVSGSVDTTSMYDDAYYVKRTKCKDDKCWEAKVSCTKRTAALSAQIRISNVSTGVILYDDKIGRQQAWSHCADDADTLPSKAAGVQELADSIAADFVYKLTPHYRNVSVPLFENQDMEYDDYQEKLLGDALVDIEEARYDKAEDRLNQLTDSTGAKSYIPFYYIGIIYEIRGNFYEAQKYYLSAQKLSVKPVTDINAAVTRMKGLIEQEELTHKQIAK